MKYLILIIAMVLAPLYSMGQNYSYSAEKPFWVKGYFKEVAMWYIEVVSAFEYDLKGAKDKAAKEILRRRSLATGADVNVKLDGSNVQVASEHNLIVKARIVDEYIDHMPDGYTVYLLVQTAKNPTFTYEPVILSDEYKFSGRVFVPGMAQLYKGSKTKGTCIIAAEALSVASIIVCENQRASYNKKAIENSKYAKEYSSKASNWETGRNISIGVAAGIWAYNIIDGIIAKGKKRILVGHSREDGLSVSPYITNNASGISMAYHF